METDVQEELFKAITSIMKILVLKGPVVYYM